MTSRDFPMKTLRRQLAAGVVLLLAVGMLGGWTWFWQEGDSPSAPKPHDERTWFGRGWEPGQAPRRDVRFNHNWHVVDQELECTDCHEGAESEDKAGLPEMEACAECHDETDDTTDEKAGCLLCHEFRQPHPDCTDEHCAEEDLPDITATIGPQPYRNLRYPSDERPGGFSHETHFENGIECAQCHGGIREQDSDFVPSGRYMPKPQRCLDCHGRQLRNFTHERHAEKEVACSACHGDATPDDSLALPAEATIPQGVPTSVPPTCAECHEPVSSDCVTCHLPGTYDRTVPPDSHRAGWERFHGTAGRLTQAGQHGTDCFTCHAQQACEACHNTRPPQDHTNFWRVRGHGLMAAGDRERCTTCHRQDFCEACHRETAPRTHIGTWSSSRHCPWCHLSAGFSSTDENCRVCHRTILHATAPHPINTGNCFGSGCHSPTTGIAPFSMPP